jgi:hypothetical protein
VDDEPELKEVPMHAIIEKLKGKPEPEPRWGVSSLDWADVADQVVRLTSGFRFGGLRVKADRLSNSEQHRLVELTWKARTEEETREWEQLVELASDSPGVFKAVREEEEATLELRQLARRAAKPGAIRREQELGLLEAVAEALFDRSMWADHALITFTILCSMFTERELVPGSRVERDERGQPVLVIQSQFGLLSMDRDGESRLASWQWALKHLATNKWFVVTWGSEVRIALGPTALRVLRMEGS